MGFPSLRSPWLSIIQGEIKSRTKSKKELEAEAEAARDEALRTAIDPSNRGFQMMAKLGFKPGSALGKSEDARTEPIQLVRKEDRGGIGHINEKKRKFDEAAEEEAKRAKMDPEEYRERIRQEREQKRFQSQMFAAQKVAEQFDETREDAGEEQKPTKASLDSRPLKSINVLWRGLVRDRLEKERERQLKLEMQAGTRDDPEDSDEEDLGKDTGPSKDAIAFQELDEEDLELAEFEALPPQEQLEKLVQYLRKEKRYCFYCKYQYEDDEMDGCPGPTEEDHD